MADISALHAFSKWHDIQCGSELNSISNTITKYHCRERGTFIHVCYQTAARQVKRWHNKRSCGGEKYTNGQRAPSYLIGRDNIKSRGKGQDRMAVAVVRCRAFGYFTVAHRFSTQRSLFPRWSNPGLECSRRNSKIMASGQWKTTAHTQGA